MASSPHKHSWYWVAVPWRLHVPRCPCSTQAGCSYWRTPPVWNPRLHRRGDWPRTSCCSCPRPPVTTTHTRAFTHTNTHTDTETHKRFKTGKLVMTDNVCFQWCPSRCIAGIYTYVFGLSLGPLLLLSASLILFEMLFAVSLGSR